MVSSSIASCQQSLNKLSLFVAFAAQQVLKSLPLTLPPPLPLADIVRMLFTAGGGGMGARSAQSLEGCAARSLGDVG